MTLQYHKKNFPKEKSPANGHQKITTPLMTGNSGGPAKTAHARPLPSLCPPFAASRSSLLRSVPLRTATSGLPALPLPQTNSFSEKIQQRNVRLHNFANSLIHLENFVNQKVPHDSNPRQQDFFCSQNRSKQDFWGGSVFSKGNFSTKLNLNKQRTFTIRKGSVRIIANEH